MSDKRKIREIKKQLSRMERLLKKLEKEANEDGIVLPSEEADLRAVEERINELTINLARAEGLLTEIVFTEDEVDVIVVNAPVDWDDDPKAKFNSNMASWANAVRNELNKIHNQYNNPVEDEAFSLSDLVSILSLIPKIGTYIETAHTIYEAVKKLSEAAIPSSKVTLDELHDTWDTALTNYWRQGSYDDEFAAFKKEFESKNSDYSKTDVMNAIDKLKSKLPIKAVGRRLLKEVLDNIPDSMDWDDEAGIAEVDMMEMGMITRKVSGQLDDVGPNLMRAIRSAWGKSAKIIDLPIKIEVTIKNNMGGNKTVIRRESKSPGNKSFRYVSGDQDIFKKFMDQKAYEYGKVSDLKHDD